MDDRERWGLIRSGATFEGLVGTIVYFKDPDSKHFCRPGPDGGQDVVSGDCKTVFQAKYHSDFSAARAIRDAISEAGKIEKYRAEPHPRSGQWQGAENWRLVTNAEFGPGDKERWALEVVPAFLRLRLHALYWDLADLTHFLLEYPAIDRTFFRNETPALVTLPEAWERFASEAPHLQRATGVALRGRETEFAWLRRFVQDPEKSFVLTTGPGGVGKTRLLLDFGSELAREGWQVLWGNVATMESGAWFEAIIPERQTLLLVDDPEDDRLLRQLREQVGIGRAKHWKAAISVRSSNDPVLRFFGRPSLSRRVEELQLGPLAPSAALELTRDLLSGGKLASTPETEIESTAKRISHIAGQNPIWISLAVELLERGQALSSLPATGAGLAQWYVDELCTGRDGFDSAPILAVLRRVALLGTVNCENDGAVTFVQTGSGIADRAELLRCLGRLVDRSAIVQRGARSRLIEIKPDVVRDHVLRTWLVIDTLFIPRWRPSGDAERLVDELLEALLRGRLSYTQAATLRALARVEWLHGEYPGPVPLLDRLFAVLRESAPTLDAARRLVLASTLESVAWARPSDVVDILRTFRTSPSPDVTVEGMLGTHVVGHDDVVLGLAWPAYHAALGTRVPQDKLRVLGELCELVEAEEEIAVRAGRLPNDGKRAADLVRRLLEGGPGFWGEFDGTAQELGLALLDEAARSHGVLTRGRSKRLRVLVQSAAAIERTYSINDGDRIVYGRYRVPEGHPGWDARHALMARLRQILADELPEANAETLWGIFAELVIEARAVPDQSSALPEELAALRWTYQILSSRRASVRELYAARRMWSWHLGHAPDEEFKAVAAALEAIYQADDLSREFVPLTEFEDLEKLASVARDKALQLAGEHKSDALAAFVDRAVRFLGEEGPARVSQVSWFLGTLAPDEGSVGDFVRQALARARGPDFRFAAQVTRSWLSTLRLTGRGTTASELAIELADLPVDEGGRADLLWRLYGSYTPRMGNLSAGEHDLLRGSAGLFVRADLATAFFQASAWSFDFDWPGYKRSAEWVLDQLAGDRLRAGVNALCETVGFGLRVVDRGEQTAPPPELGRWLLEQLVRLPDIDMAGDAAWHVEEVLKATCRPDLAWLVSALRLRLAHGERTQAERFQAVPTHHRLSGFVVPINAATAGNEEARTAIGELLELALTRPEGYWLQKYLRDVDPEGLVVPELAVARVPVAPKVDDQPKLWALSRVAAAYEVGSPPWRLLASPLCKAVRPLDERTRSSVFHSLGDAGPVAWSSSVGQVAGRFPQAVEDAQNKLDSELDADLLPYWRWALDVAKRDLAAERERAKEDRGE